MLSTLNGTTSFCSVTEATVATPEFGFEDLITFPVLPSNSMSVCVWEGGREKGRGRGRGEGEIKRNRRSTESERVSGCVEERQSNIINQQCTRMMQPSWPLTLM